MENTGIDMKLDVVMLFHTTCFRRWLECSNCLFCGDIPEIKNDRYCDVCGSLGHNPTYGDVCPTVKKMSDQV